MAKKKLPKWATKNKKFSLRIHLKSIFTAKLTKKQNTLSSIFIIILFTGLGLFFFSTYIGFELRESLFQIKYELTQSLALPNIPTQSVKPTPIIIPSSPTNIPQATHTEQLPNQIFNKLIVYQTSSSNKNRATFTKVITDPTKIKELYNDIKSLPFWPQSVIPMSCPAYIGVEYAYILNFYSNDVLTVHALLHPTGCAGVDITNYKPRLALSPKGEKLFNDLQQTLNLSRQEFY